MLGQELYTNGQYNVKMGYQMWHNFSIGTATVTQANGWSKIWHLDVPHKVRIFLWRICRNSMPIWKRLSSKIVSLPIIYSMCNSDIEHSLQIFFKCPFVNMCWQYAGRSYDMHLVEYAPDWLFQKINGASHDEIILIAKVLWDIWFFRNKKVRENKVVNYVVVVDWNTKAFADWKEAKQRRM